MAQIINYNAQDNPQLNELYQILLLAGYFRIRIGSLKAFDKVIGGMAWCITSSNFQIEVDYSDQMQIGQKIKVAEKICEALHLMKCPYILQPFQLQGLDVNNIYPVIQWLVKLVYETRLENQKYNRNLSYLLGKRIIGEYDRGNTHKIPKILNQRIKVNKAMASTSYTNPFRVYSALLQFEDKSSLRMYNKLLHLSNQKSKTKTGQTKNSKESKEGKQQLLTFLQEDQKQDEKIYQKDTNDFGSVGKMSLQRLQKMIQQSKEQIEQGIIEEEQAGQQDVQNCDQQGVKQKQDRTLKNFRLETQKYESQLQVLNNQLQSLNGFQKQLLEYYNSVDQSLIFKCFTYNQEE